MGFLRPEGHPQRGYFDGSGYFVDSFIESTYSGAVLIPLHESRK